MSRVHCIIRRFTHYMSGPSKKYISKLKLPYYHKYLYGALSSVDVEYYDPLTYSKVKAYNSSAIMDYENEKSVVKAYNSSVIMDYENEKSEVKAYNSSVIMDYDYNHDSVCQCSNDGFSAVGHCPVCNV